MNRRLRFALSVLAAVCGLSTSCIPFDSAREEFCQNADPAQQQEICPRLLARIVLEPTQKATCVVMQLQTSSGAPLAEELRLERGPGQDFFSVPILRGVLPAEIQITARPYYGVGCAEPLAPNGESVKQTSRFPLEGSADVTLSLAAPPRFSDGDGDGFAGGAGPDCADDNPEVRPNATEACQGIIDLNCNGRIGCQDPACSNVTCAEPPATIAFTTPVQTITAGVCSGAVILQARNALGSPNPVLVDTQVALTAPAGAGVTFHSDSSCTGGPVTDVSIAAGASDVTLYFRTTAAGRHELTAMVAGVAPAKQTHTINPAPPSAIRFRTAAQSVSTGQCSGEATVELRDAFGNLANATSNLTVALADNLPVATDFTFHATSACAGGGIGSVTISAGASAQTFFFQGAKEGPVDVIASAAGLPSVLQQQTITRATPPQLRFVAAPTSHDADTSCSSILTVQVQDAGGTPVNVAADTTVSLASSASPASPPAAFTFYSDAGCTTAVSSVQISAGTSSGSFYFRARVAETVRITAATPSLGSATYDVSITPGAPGQLEIFSEPQTNLVAGSCSLPVTLRALDQWGNVAPVSELTTVYLSTSPYAGTTFKFFSDSGCATEISNVSIASGGSSAGFRFRGTRAGAITVQLSATALTADSQGQVIVPGDASALRFVSASQRVSENTCSGVASVEVIDSYGNRATAASLAIGLSGPPTAGMTFHTDPTCSNPAVTQVMTTEGVANFYWKAAGMGTATIIANSAPLTLAQQDQVVSSINLVRSGTCTMASSGQSCTITGGPVESLSRSILFWQATAPDKTAEASAVMCFFQDTSTIRCGRDRSGGAVEIAWYVVTFPASLGVQVEHRSPVSAPVPFCSGSATSLDVTLNRAVDASRSFVLLSSYGSGNEFEMNYFKRALLSSDGTKVTIFSRCSGTSSMALQVVEFPGAVVERGTLTMSEVIGGATLPAADLSRSFLLYTYQVPTTAWGEAANRAVRGYLSSDTHVDFSRGNGSSTSWSPIDVTYERVTLPAGNKVQAFNEAIASGFSTSMRALPVAVDTGRAVAFTGGQAASGQSMGEARYTGSPLLENINLARARLLLTNPTNLTFQRSVTPSSAQFTGYVVEFAAP
jgi:hypothetical protein